MRVHIVVLASWLVVAACGASTSNVVDSDAPFIKLADRNMGLVVAWLEPSPSAADKESFERTLAAELGARYRTKVVAGRQTGPFRELESRTFVDMVAASVDDVVVVEVRAEGGTPPAVSARVRIVLLATNRAVHDLAIPSTSGASDRGRALDRLATTTADRISRTWTDPGQNPRLDPLDAADFLATRKACRPAIAIYSDVFAKQKTARIFDIQRQDRSRIHMERCAATVALEDALLADTRARFEVRFALGGMAPHIDAAVRSAASEARIAEIFAKHTDKPVVIEMRPGAFVASLRYHPDRYAEAVRGRPTHERNLRVLHVDLWSDLMRAIAELRDRTAARLAPADRNEVARYGMVLRLQKLLDDWVEIDFGVSENGLLLSDSVRVKIGTRPEVALESASKGVTRRKTFHLGPRQTLSGELTDYGLLYTFFELGE